MGSEFGRLIGFNVFLLKLSGVIPYGRSLIVGDILAAIAFFCLSVYSVSYTFVFATKDIYSSAALESFTMIISLVGGQARFAILLLLRDRCQRMLNMCEVLWSALDTKEKEIVQSYVKKVTRLTFWYLCTCFITMFFYFIAAIFLSPTINDIADIDIDLKNATNGSLVMDRHLPYTFVVEVQGTPWYEMIYAFQVLSMTNVAITCIGEDTLGPLFALIACGHFEVIRSRMEGSSAEPGTPGRLWSSATTSSMAEAPSAEQIDSLRVYVDHHRMVYEFCDELERLTNLIFLTQLVGSTYNISLVGFKLVGDDPDKFKYVTQLLVGVIQLFLCNWPADLLRTKSEAAGQAAYSSPWYKYPYWLRRPTNLTLLRAQRPAHLTAGKFVMLSFETFASMISSAASFFTVIKTMN